MIIGLSGYAGSGKDEVAKILIQKGFERVAFADGIKNCLLKLDPTVTYPESGLKWSLRTLVTTRGWDVVKLYPEVRGLLQRMGTEAGREVFGDGVWVDLLHNHVQTDGNDIVIPDVRYPNEREWIMNMGGRVWRVNRPNYGPLNRHPSENALDSFFFDAYISNDGPLESLAEKVDEALEGIRLEDRQQEVTGFLEKARKDNRAALDELADL